MNEGRIPFVLELSKDRLRIICVRFVPLSLSFFVSSLLCLSKHSHTHRNEHKSFTIFCFAFSGRLCAREPESRKMDFAIIFFNVSRNSGWIFNSPFSSSCKFKFFSSYYVDWIFLVKGWFFFFFSFPFSFLVDAHESKKTNEQLKSNRPRCRASPRWWCDNVVPTLVMRDGQHQ